VLNVALFIFTMISGAACMIWSSYRWFENHLRNPLTIYSYPYPTLTYIHIITIMSQGRRKNKVHREKRVHY